MFWGTHSSFSWSVSHEKHGYFRHSIIKKWLSSQLNFHVQFVAGDTSKSMLMFLDESVDMLHDENLVYSISLSPNRPANIKERIATFLPTAYSSVPSRDGLHGINNFSSRRCITSTGSRTHCNPVLHSVRSRRNLARTSHHVYSSLLSNRMTYQPYFEGVFLPPPPDLPSLLLSERIIYVGTILAPRVTELIISELLYLEYESAIKPITMYINSPGTENYNGESAAYETEALAVADVMNYVKPKIRTICIGHAYGTAALLLANGEPSNRFALPNASILLKQPVGPMMTGQASDIAVSTKEKLLLRNSIIEILAENTGKSFETLLQDMQRNKYLTPLEAKEYGIIDKILTKPKDGVLNQNSFGVFNHFSSASAVRHSRDMDPPCNTNPSAVQSC
ncbi:hypothetical protein IE077_001223 [Cardiosporidium cionae]|uniref:ATP-dependent Clp protease proteolytic subunit n=1 Tax=Cardiosporidium cionae TaxID=476202 RepID=A0ABQ7J5P8_9APIC|nr:hypothetical protein IE077_001223 [Cardiosporidium cionae]|eukprot:KAF8819294.1 hypothetical protein IE077_001223 [Cardiosporidium cionae]